jgi:hypothetical protein
MASWSVCSTAAEPPELLCAFVAHYLGLGAQEVHLFLDAPDDETVGILSKIDGVRLTLCTEQYWIETNGKRPPGQIMRQIKNANRAYAQCTTDWFFFCDADEFLVSKADVAQSLSEVPETTLFCRPQMCERIFQSDRPQNELFDGLIRRMLPPRPALLSRIYGDLALMTTRGLTGHVIGKSFVRAGRDDLRIRIHFPVPYDGAAEEALKKEGRLKPGPFLRDSWLVHFDGMTALHWQLKLLRYYLDYAPLLDAGKKNTFTKRTPARSNQLNALYESRGDHAALERLLGLIRLDATVLEKLTAADGVLDLHCNPAQEARALFGQEFTFSAADFDAKLRARHAALITDYKLLG